MSTSDQGRDYAGPWFPPLTAQPVPPPAPEEPAAPREMPVPSWLVDEPEPEPQPVGTAKPRNRRRWMMPGAATMLVVACVFGAGAVAFLSGGPGSNTSLAEPELGTVADLTPADWCPEIDTRDRIQGSGKGDLRTGPGLILWILHAYFVERDPAAVRSAFAPGASVASAEATRKAIENVVPGTKHCVNIEVLSDNLFRVRVEQFKPDGSVKSTTDEYVISNVEGRPMINAVRGGDGKG